MTENSKGKPRKKETVNGKVKKIKEQKKYSEMRKKEKRGKRENWGRKKLEK